MFISPVSETIAPDVAAAAGADLRLQDIILLPEARKFDVFKASNVALSCSGTVTSQLACAGIPTVVGYRLNPLTFAVAKHLYKPEYISIVNVAADELLMPEFVQSECNGQNLAGAVLQYLENPDILEKARQSLRTQTRIMKGEGGLGAKRAAEAVRRILL